MIWRVPTIILITFLLFVMHRRFLSFWHSSLTTFWLPFLTQCAERLNSGRSFTTLWSYRDELRGVMFGVRDLQHLVSTSAV